jgi:hypothetical protein
MCVCLYSGKWLVGPSSTSSTTASFLFNKAMQDVTTEFNVQWQMHRARDASVLGCHSFVKRVAMYRVTNDCRACLRAASTEALSILARLLALKLSR